MLPAPGRPSQKYRPVDDLPYSIPTHEIAYNYKKDNVFSVASAEGGGGEYSIHHLLCCDNGHFGLSHRAVKNI
jgi:hypothetical protein